MVAFAFNAEQYTPQYGGGGGGLPPGRHPVVITNSEWKPAKEGNGNYLALTLTAIDGPAKGSFQIDRMNLENKSAQAIEIATKQLAAYCYVCGLRGFQDSQQLHNIPFIAIIGQQPPNADGSPSKYTQVTGLETIRGEPLPGAQPTAPAHAAPAAQPPQPQAAPQQQQQPPAQQQGQWGGAPAGQPAPQQQWGGGAPAGAPAPAPQGQWAPPAAQPQAGPVAGGQWGGAPAQPAAQPAAPAGGGWQPPPGVGGGAGPGWGGPR